MRCEHGDDPCCLYLPGNQVSRPIIAFFEIVIWLLAREIVMKDLSSSANFLACASGFAMGTYVGFVKEGKLSIGRVILRMVTTDAQ